MKNGRVVRCKIEKRRSTFNVRQCNQCWFCSGRHAIERNKTFPVILKNCVYIRNDAKMFGKRCIVFVTEATKTVHFYAGFNH